MVDYIKIMALTKCLFNPNSFEPFKWRGLIFYPKFRNGKLIGFESEYRGFRVVLYYDRIELSNSIHKFFKGNNYSDFTYSELKCAIYEICKWFAIEPQYWEIKKMEFGFCIITPQPANQYLNVFFEYKLRQFEKMKHQLRDYGRKCFMYEYALKVYDKNLQVEITDNLNISDWRLRIEFCYNQKRKLPKTIRTLGDLLDNEKFKHLYKDLNEAFSKVVYNDEVDFSKSTNEERILFYASLNPDFIKVEEQLNKAETKIMKSKIKRLRERFLKKEFKKWFLKTLSDKYIELYCS
ncbi:hypothetical protein [Bergeyella sp. RCAD1439]|uniref:hypothetical protein n=1 Tax=Bergeyella anatis TaxID=3113737 RepID=UPI002E177415|nr:hypothetical protein [Bergeyella sp. RCAD1439]